MLYSDLSGDRLSRLGFGTMRLPQLADGKIDEAAVERMDKGMPVLLLSGQDDPVGDQGKGVAALAGLSKGAAQMPFTRNFSRCSSR